MSLIPRTETSEKEEMADLRVESLLRDTTVIECAAAVRGDLSPDNRERMLGHIIADLAMQVLRSPGTNPRGLLITVTSDLPSPSDPHPDFRVLASAPTYV